MALVHTEVPELVPGHRLVEHRNVSWWTPAHGLRLYVSEMQCDRGRFYAHPGPALLERMHMLPVANLDVARYVLTHGAPDSWESGRRTFTFWGTVAENTDGVPLVPQMYFDVRWRLMFVPLYYDGRRRNAVSWDGNEPAVLLCNKEGG